MMRNRQMKRESNLMFYDGLISGELVYVVRQNDLKSNVMRKQTTDFPLTDDELVHIENIYRIFNRINFEIERILEQSEPVPNKLFLIVKDSRPEVEVALHNVGQTLKRF